MKLYRVSAIAVLALVTGGALGYAAFLRPRLLAGMQVRNHGLCQTHEAWLKSYFEKHGHYPSELSAAVPERFHTDRSMLDNWGHPLHYESDGEFFILVSYGRDGMPDGQDYRALRSSGDHPSGYDIRGSVDADEVMSDQGWHRICGK